MTNICVAEDAADHESKHVSTRESDQVTNRTPCGVIGTTQHYLGYFGVIAALLISPAALAHWQLNNQLSQLNFTTIKAGNIAENHRFGKLSGSVDDNGAVRVSIDVTSVNTNIPIRDERLRTMLFQTVDFPAAEFTAQIDAAEMQALTVGSSKIFSLKGKLTIRDQTIRVATSVLATRVNSRGVLINTLSPILIDAASFGLSPAVEALREIAGLPSISTSVPVTFALTFSG